MEKPFEITYSPANWTAPPTGQAVTWITPYGGLNVEAPENLLGPQFTPKMDNFMFRNAELRSRPAFKQLLPGPDGTNIILAVGSFLSNAQVWHTMALTPRGLFQLLPNSQNLLIAGQNPWQFLGGPTLQTAPIIWQSYAGIFYYGNGAHLSAWDGQANEPITDVAFLGATNPPPSDTTVFGGLFLSELDNHIIIAYVTETTNGEGVVIPNRMRWSNDGFSPILNGVFGANLGTLGGTFDPSIALTAGSNDFVDVPDIITGLMTVGQQGYMFRQNGITSFAPTGNGAAPFDFNHLWASQNGVGSVYPFSLAQYGNVGMFVSYENIYQMQGQNLSAVGGGARDAIMTDLANATGSPKASIDRAFTLGYTYLVYHLRIPLTNSTRSYVFSFDDGNWASWTESGSWPTGLGNECWV